MKIIEFLAKCMANDETLPDKIKILSEVYYKHYEDDYIYYENEVGTNLMQTFRGFYELNREVEIMEDEPIKDKEIEKIPKEKIDEYLWEYRGDEVYGLKLFVANILNDKLNEVIDVVNKLNKKVGKK